MGPKRELKTTYWYGLFVPIVISALIMTSLLVLVTVNVGEPHELLKKIKSAGPPKLGLDAVKLPGVRY